MIGHVQQEMAPQDAQPDHADFKLVCLRFMLPRSIGSNVGQDVKIFIILILTPFSFAKTLFRFDEFNALYPFHHFIAKLIFNTQAKRSTILVVVSNIWPKASLECLVIPRSDR